MKLRYSILMTAIIAFPSCSSSQDGVSTPLSDDLSSKTPHFSLTLTRDNNRMKLIPVCWEGATIRIIDIRTARFRENSSGRGELTPSANSFVSASPKGALTTIELSEIIVEHSRLAGETLTCYGLNAFSLEQSMIKVHCPKLAEREGNSPPASPDNKWLAREKLCEAMGFDVFENQDFPGTKYCNASNDNKRPISLQRFPYYAMNALCHDHGGHFNRKLASCTCEGKNSVSIDLLLDTAAKEGSLDELFQQCHAKEDPVNQLAQANH